MGELEGGVWAWLVIVLVVMTVSATAILLFLAFVVVPLAERLRARRTARRGSAGNPSGGA